MACASVLEGFERGRARCSRSPLSVPSLLFSGLADRDLVAAKTRALMPSLMFEIGIPAWSSWSFEFG